MRFTLWLRVSCSATYESAPFLIFRLLTIIATCTTATINVPIPARSLHSQNESFKLAILPLWRMDTAAGGTIHICHAISPYQSIGILQTHDGVSITPHTIP